MLILFLLVLNLKANKKDFDFVASKHLTTICCHERVSISMYSLSDSTTDIISATREMNVNMSDRR